jgi:hypothetical protein
VIAIPSNPMVLHHDLLAIRAPYQSGDDLNEAQGLRVVLEPRNEQDWTTAANPHDPELLRTGRLVWLVADVSCGVSNDAAERNL